MILYYAPYALCFPPLVVSNSSVSRGSLIPDCRRFHQCTNKVFNLPHLASLPRSCYRYSLKASIQAFLYHSLCGGLTPLASYHELQHLGLRVAKSPCTLFRKDVRNPQFQARTLQLVPSTTLTSGAFPLVRIYSINPPQVSASCHFVGPGRGVLFWMDIATRWPPDAQYPVDCT